MSDSCNSDSGKLSDSSAEQELYFERYRSTKIDNFILGGSKVSINFDDMKHTVVKKEGQSIDGQDMPNTAINENYNEEEAD